MTGKEKNLLIVVSILFIADFLLFYHILFFNRDSVSDARLYFLNVGQGDSSLVDINGTKFMIDTGRGWQVVNEMDKINGLLSDKYIDVVFLSHPDKDHVGGIFYLLDRYDIGVVLYDGVENDLWRDIKDKLDSNGIKYVYVDRGDKVKFADNEFDILWPDSDILGRSDNDNSLVIRFCDDTKCVLYTGDITQKVESDIAKSGEDLSADILKVAHHGSKYSSSINFLSAISPKIAIIEVGKNSYGHPSKDVLDRINKIGARIFRTDLDGLIEVISEEGLLKVFRVE